MGVRLNHKIPWSIIGMVVAAFFIIVVVMPILLTRTWGAECLKFTESTGWIGDTLGGITAPFIGFVNIILLIWTLHKQIIFNNKQLLEQKNEQFKAAFFQMLQTQRELLHEVKGSFLSRNMKGDVVGGKVEGVDYFRDAGMELKTLFCVLDGDVNTDDNLFGNVKDKYGLTDEVMDEYSQANYEGQMKIAYKLFFDAHLETGNYFRHLYHILKFISEEKIDELDVVSDEDEKMEIVKRYKGYADLLQATLSVEELKMAYYNCSAFENAKVLFKEFQFVENLTKGNLIRPEKDLMEGFLIKEVYVNGTSH